MTKVLESRAKHMYQTLLAKSLTALSGLSKSVLVSHVAQRQVCMALSCYVFGGFLVSWRA